MHSHRSPLVTSKTNLSKWGYADTADTACECGTSEQTMQHLLRCPLLENECSLEDLATANEKALHCARAWPNIWLSSEMMDTKEEVTSGKLSLLKLTGWRFNFAITCISHRPQWGRVFNWLTLPQLFMDTKNFVNFWLFWLITENGLKLRQFYLTLFHATTSWIPSPLLLHQGIWLTEKCINDVTIKPVQVQCW